MAKGEKLEPSLASRQFQQTPDGALGEGCVGAWPWACARVDGSGQEVSASPEVRPPVAAAAAAALAALAAAARKGIARLRWEEAEPWNSCPYVSVSATVVNGDADDEQLHGHWIELTII